MKRKDVSKQLDALLPNLAIAPPATVELGACECGGLGMVPTEDSQGRRVMRDCVCRVEKRIASRLRRAELPERYQTTTLDTFDALTASPSIARGLATARRFTQEYPVGTNGRGLLLTGPVGTGKTHLAVGVLRSLVLDKGALGLFWDFRELLNKIKATFNGGGGSEGEVLAPVFAADVLVLDELGAARLTDFSFDIVETVLNGRYNKNKTTIITSNLPNLPPGGTADVDGGGEYAAAARSAMRSETLGDRIGARMHSRLQQMCIVVEMHGEDYRSKKGRR
jgi:DNA replication protein DnaC